MDIDYRQIYQEFENAKHLKEYSEYVSEINEINTLLNTIPFDSIRAAQVCSDLAGKYEAEINQQPGQFGVKKTVVRGQNLLPKTDAELVSDLQYFRANIPYFALKREIKSDLQRFLLGL